MIQACANASYYISQTSHPQGVQPTLPEACVCVGCHKTVAFLSSSLSRWSFFLMVRALFSTSQTLLLSPLSYSGISPWFPLLCLSSPPLPFSLSLPSSPSNGFLSPLPRNCLGCRSDRKEVELHGRWVRELRQSWGSERAAQEERERAGKHRSKRQKEERGRR